MAAKTRDGNADSVKSVFWIVDLAIHVGLWLLLASIRAVIADLVAAHLLWRDDPVGAGPGAPALLPERDDRS